jgi:hypothetical protein
MVLRHLHIVDHALEFAGELRAALELQNSQDKQHSLVDRQNSLVDQRV